MLLEVEVQTVAKCIVKNRRKTKGGSYTKVALLQCS